jgi:hypothetical protein
VGTQRRADPLHDRPGPRRRQPRAMNAEPTLTARYLWRHPLAWTLLPLAGVLAATMTFSYLYGSLEPTRRLQDFPVGIVNLDRGATFGTERVNAGTQLVATATTPLRAAHQPVKWHVLSTRSALLRALHDRDVEGGFVVPPDFSARIVTLGMSLGHAPPARIDVLKSSGVGTFGVTVFDQVTQRVVSGASNEVRAQLVSRFQQFGVQIQPTAIAALGDPVRAHSVDAVPIGGRSGAGLSPFFFAFIMTLAGFVAATSISIGMDVLAGHEEFDVLGRIIRYPARGVTESVRWRAKLAAVLAMAPLAALIQTVVAVDLLGMDTSSWTKTFLFAWLGIAAIGALVLVFLCAFGIAGELVAIVFITVLGIPASLGIFPEYAIPSFFRFIASWHPMRFETDGARAILFFNARGTAGLADAVWVLLAYLASSIVVGGLVAAAVDHFRSRLPIVLTPR